MTRVSIPHTSTSADGTHTLYHIVVKSPTGTYTLEKRYSDFWQLRQELESLYSDQLPYRFPGKSYLRSGVTNTALVESRRETLEKFLQDCVSDGLNIKWRKSLPFREFLNLPPGALGNESRNSGVSAAWKMASRQDEAITDVSLWIDTAREVKQLLNDARGKVFIEAGEAKKLLILARMRFEGLSKGLESFEIGNGEAKRRSELLNSLKREHEDIESLLSTTNATNSRPPTKGRIIGEAQETERTRQLDNQQLLQVQKEDMSTQDEQLNQLHKAIQRQRQLGEAINEELAIQNELLDELEGETDRVGSKLHYAKHRVGKFT